MLQTLSNTVRSTIRSARRRELESFIRHYYFSASLRKKLADRLGLSDQQSIERVLAGLREYFILCLDARDMVLGMPSKSVDVAWHEFILHTRDYTDFCRRAYGTYLHHTPNDESAADDDYFSGAGRTWMDLGRTWILSCIGSDQDPRHPAKMPLLFALDAELGLPDGATYTLDDLAALPVPPGFIETEPGRYRYIARKNRKKHKANTWGSDGGGFGGGGGCTAGNGGGHHGHGSSGCGGGHDSGSCGGGGCGGN